MTPPLHSTVRLSKPRYSCLLPLKVRLQLRLLHILDQGNRSLIHMAVS